MSVVEAVARELAALPDGLGESGLAAAALALAESVDDPSTRPTAKAMCARELRETMSQLRQLAPAKLKSSKIDDIARKRTERHRRQAEA